MFETFDQPNLVNSVDRRNRTTIAPQALILMNNGMVLTQAKKFAERLKKEAGDGRRQAGRPRVPARAGAAARRVRAQASRSRSSRQRDGLTDFCHALFNLNEFVYRQ